METSVVPEEENCVSRLAGSITQIKAISIDLNFPKEMRQAENFWHDFSILGYAAEMREKNLKASNPFQYDGNLNDFEDQLPPLPVPKIRRCRCSKCHRNIDNASANEETELIPDNVSTSLEKVSGDYSDVPSETPQGPTPIQIDQKKITEACFAAAADVEIESVEATATADMDVRDDEAIADIGDTHITGNYKVLHKGTDGETDDVLVLSELQRAENCGLSKVLPQEKMESTNDEQRIGEKPVNLGDPVGNTNEAAVVETVDSVVPLEVEEMNNTLSDSYRSQQDVPSITLSRRKIRKVRLLADLLGEQGSMKSNHLKQGDLTSSSKLLVSTEAATSLPFDRILCDDVSRDADSPQEKGKMPQVEDGLPNQGTLAAKFNDPMTKTDAELTVKRSEIPSSIGQANAPSEAGLQIGNKADRLKRKAERNHFLVKKKRKPAHVHDAFPPTKFSEELPESANGKNGDSKRCSTASKMFLSKLFGSPSAAGEPNNNPQDHWSSRETDKLKINSIQTALQIQNFTTVNDQSSVMGLLTLDSCLQRIGSSGNQDSEKSSVLLKKNDFCFRESGIQPASEPELLKKRQVLDLNETAAHSSSCCLARGSLPLPKEDFFCIGEQEKAFENQGPSRPISEQFEQRDGKAVVQGSSDDIPMEIVELMAKNQYERALGNAGNHLIPARTINPIRRFPALQDIRKMECPALGYSGLTSFSSPNASSSMSIPSANMPAKKGSSMDYSQMGRNHFNMVQVDERKRSIFTAFVPNQQITSGGRQFSAAASIRIGPQCSEVVEPSLLSGAMVMPFGLGSPQNFSELACKSCYKGKTISDIKADELKKNHEAHSAVSKPGELNHKLKGQLNPYANENIPAMQLLSLMDEKSPGVTFNGGTSRILDKALTPPGCHLKSNADGRTGFLDGSIFLHHNQTKESSGLGICAHNGKQCSGWCPFAFSGALSIESPGQDRLRESLHISGSDVDVSYAAQNSRGKDKQKAVVVYSDIPGVPNQHSAPDDSQRFLEIETENGKESIMPMRNVPPCEFCSLNRNPAEFSSPEAGNEFTIHGRDLKFRKRRYSRSQKSSMRIGGPKLQRNLKAKAGKDKGQNNEA